MMFLLFLAVMGFMVADIAKDIDKRKRRVRQTRKSTQQRRR